MLNHPIELFDKYLSDSQIFWPSDTYFHNRNRQKIGKALSKYQGMSTFEIAEQLFYLAQNRVNNEINNIHLMSCGSSGCHFCGDLLNGIDGFLTMEEIYYSTVFISWIENNLKIYSDQLIDMINLFHAYSVPSGNEVTVNIGHYRKDVSLDTLRSLTTNSKFTLLIRDPFDVVVSRTFRKDDYKNAVDRECSRTDYQKKQTNYVKNFYLQTFNEKFDKYIRYEVLKENPYQVMLDILKEFNLSIDIEKLQASCYRNYYRNLNKFQNSSSNFNPEIKSYQDYMSNQEIQYLSGELAEVRLVLGYGFDNYIN